MMTTAEDRKALEASLRRFLSDQASKLPDPPAGGTPVKTRPKQPIR